MLPIYELKINESLTDDSEVSVVSFVDEPAIMKDFLVFKDETTNPNLSTTTKHSFQIVNEEQRIVSGPLMVADQLIYRNNDKMGEHYVKFSAETIKNIAIKFSKRKYQMNVNIMHDPKMNVEGVTMFESFIVDKTRGIQPMDKFNDVPDGSWFGSFYVENPDVWDAVKKGQLRGFSVEGLFQYDEPTTPEEQALKKISSLLNELID